jgi:hypothetical protein
MAAGATLVVAETVPVSPDRLITATALYRTPGVPGGVPSLIGGSGLGIRHMEPIRTVAFVVGAVRVAADQPGRAWTAPRRPVLIICG